jgi:hypothetical protein
LLVETPDRLLGDRAVGIVNERETSRSSGLPVGREHDLGGGADARQMLA